VPPHLRGQAQPRPKLNIRDEELPDNLKSKGSEEGLSKSALKNKKKREAKKTAAAANLPPNSAYEHGASGALAGTAAPTCSGNGTSEPGQQQMTGDPELNKKLKGIQRKLNQIAGLKQQQAEGKTLEANQLDKISKEDQLIAEMNALLM
jgi:translation initiation factor 2A